ncbi:hypothetical protein BTO30_12365 [Domibacillus antri]|uniref:Uncharacterized protein n=1 Tax=Domibacillus antri TaxID=1714264 RepID=A0A1Q8Q3F7_9BACI|nr:hypothetical protein [Domibacillus antri]OLN21886.1 hypothetical protein BTO30_12365 [Domibacillus antri]
MEKRYYYITPDDWETAERNNLNRSTVRSRVNTYGWDIDRAVTTPANPIKRYAFTKEEKELMDKNGLKLNTVYCRIRRGWDRREAVTTPAMSLEQAGKIARKVNCTRFTEEQLIVMEQNGTPYNTAFNRVAKLGWSVEEAISTPVMSRDAALKRAWAESPFRNTNDVLFKPLGARSP